MRRTLPEQIVAVVEALAEDLADWCVAGRDRTLAEHEEAVLERVRQVLPLLLGAVVEQATSRLDVRLAGARAAYPGCGRQAGPHGRPRRRQVMTQCGTVTVERPWYSCRACGHGRGVVETTLGVVGGTRVSEGLRGWVARLGAAAPFQGAAEVLAALTGLELGAETLRRHAEAAGTALRKADRLTDGVAPVLTALRAKAPTADAAEVLRLERGDFATHAERMRYPALRLDGLPPGSDAIESAADHLVQRRMKRAGMRRSDTGGDAILALRARRRSRRPLTLPRPRSSRTAIAAA